MKPWLKWLVIGLVLALFAAGALRALSARQTQKEALQAQQAAQKIQAVVALAPTDLVQVKTIELSQGLAIAGPLKAVNSAVVKARVAGELQGLSVREGDFVKAGQVIARVDSTEFQARVRQAQQQAESAKAQVDIAKRSFDNNRSLVDQGFISKTALESSLATLSSAQSNYRAAQAGADVASKSLQDTVLRAPISGLIAQRLAQPGERVAVDARVVEIVDLSRLELEASLSATDSLLVKVGQTARITIEGATQPLTAKVVRVNPSAVAGSRAVLAYLALESSTGLRQGLFAQGTLEIGTARTLAAPLSAVRTDKPQPYVQLVSSDQVTHQTVELGTRGEFKGQTLVGLKGVNEDAMILSGSVGVLRAGTLVKLAPGTP
ncbi:efflux RND transporter periplasmic adaptor subunit [Rhodoferax ferrireducens]|uniref:efflux RND transporter periplasmic adaptor subunit n=1 Tax=Rhodoferax ferrireducens TaxID=192843 RepID=UPI000E0DAF37|nr:efflux RND transporter periplasmic adaptor subunit [Rhodoferax ferrireducens]